MTSGDTHPDPYSEMAMLGEQDFELRGSGLVVPLHFQPDASFIVRTILTQEAELTASEIADIPDFRAMCGSTYALGRFTSVISHLRFTLDALGSNVISIRKAGMTNLYHRNPDYTIVEEQPRA